jgi:hypothetical protein
MRASGTLGLLLLAFSLSAWTQDASPPPAASQDAMAAAVHELQEQVRELRAAVLEMRTEAAQYRAETSELRRELQATRQQLVASSGAAPRADSYSSSASPAALPDPNLKPPQEPGAKPTGSLEDRVAALEDSAQLVSSKVDDQYQTKVESASKYKLRLSGIVLLNLFSNRGVTDNQDVPNWANPPAPFEPKGNFGATLRQSEVGLEVFGPSLAGARTSGNLQLDFSGGFPATENGVNFGIARLRIASMRLDWDHTSVVAGQDNLFLSPLSPTSFASLSIPQFAYAGNLWGWIPQVRVEHRFDLSENQSISLQGGVVDNLTGELPYDTFHRSPQAGEASSQPGFGVRVAWTRNVFGRALTLGGAGYYSRQDWGFNRHVDGWAGMTDWEIPIAPRITLSGEFYRGLAAGGLGGAIGRSVLFDRNPMRPDAELRALDSMGGWSQLKVKATAKLEFNGAFGLDNPFAEDVRPFSAVQSYFGLLSQNRGTMVNFIYRPRSNLLLSTEYRHLTTYAVDTGEWSADQVNLMMGILF